MTRVKICGLSRTDDIEYANILLPDHIGFVFAESSRRVSPAQAGALRAKLDGRIAAVGVFADAPVELIAGLLADGVIDIAQLHGVEDARYISELKNVSGAAVIKALPARADRSEYEGLADYLLFDAFSADGSGGSGNRFDWSEIGDVNTPFFLAGGLTPENAAEAARAVSPYCLDVSSGVETDGRKDFEKMKRFIEIVRGSSNGRTFRVESD
ncbi:MAG: phosphoribosylanthranilate isomerase [Oscillospiraceae bacterium]|jgi:phosphoribosylanthranilate isomerase|nr:phosphoribosylanthranilate isomerase [Oscillospiraceae bacterium]